jgi:hypothetical protein
VALAQLDLALAIGILAVHERDRDLGAVEQAGAHLVLHDAALGEHPHEIQVVDREPGIAPDRRALEAGIRAVDLTPEPDVPVVVGEEELCAVLARDPPDRREPACLRIEMRPHGGGKNFGHGSREGWRNGAWPETSGPELDDRDCYSARRIACRSWAGHRNAPPSNNQLVSHAAGARWLLNSRLSRRWPH